MKNEGKWRRQIVAWNNQCKTNGVSEDNINSPYEEEMKTNEEREMKRNQ